MQNMKFLIRDRHFRALRVTWTVPKYFLGIHCATTVLPRTTLLARLQDQNWQSEIPKKISPDQGVLSGFIRDPRNHSTPKPVLSKNLKRSRISSFSGKKNRQTELRERYNQSCLKSVSESWEQISAKIEFRQLQLLSRESKHVRMRLKFFSWLNI